jgi:hypothetical protein
VERLCSRIALGERALSVLSRTAEDEPVRRVLLVELSLARSHLALLTGATYACRGHAGTRTVH